MKCIFLVFLFIGFSHQRQQSFDCKETSHHESEILSESCVVHQVFDSRGVYDMMEKFPSKVITGISFQNSSLLAIPRKVFTKFTELRRFDGTNVDFRLLSRDDFVDAHNLTELLLAGNLIQELQDGIFSSLRKLQKLDLSRNFISTISESTFAGISDVLTFIDLSNNKLRNLDYAALAPLAHHKKSPIFAKLNRNSIKDIKESRRVNHLYFDQLHLEGNFLQSFSCPDVRIKELHISNNQLQTMSFDNCSVEYLVASSNKLNWLHVHGDLKGLIASKNDIDSFVISGDSEMYHLELAQNGNIENIFASLKSMDNLQYVNLSNSIIGILHEDTFARMTELKYLFLGNAGIQIIPFGIFANNRHLITLDLSNNELQTIDLHMFTGLNHLRTLDLTGNDLRHIENFDKIRSVLPELQQLEINGNNWKCQYLSTLIRSLSVQGISVTSSENFIYVEKEKSISGIGCH